MTPEQQAVIDAAKKFVGEYYSVVVGDLRQLVETLLESEKPAPGVFPDPPTDLKIWQHVDGGRRDGTVQYKDLVDPKNWRELRVTYTPMGEPSPAERIAELEAEVSRHEAQRESLFANANDLANRIAELEALVERRNEQLREANLPDSFDDSDLLWGVQYSTGEVVGWHNEQDARANAANSSRAHKCLVRLRVIEVPE